MSIRIRYFASLKENIGRSEDVIVADNILTMKDVWLTANSKQAVPDNILVAINMDYAEMDSTVKDGDEVAFFPPVTGG